MSERPIALVTGGAQGIGYACAEALAEDGHRPILADIREDGVREAAGRLGDGAAGLICDMGDPPPSPRCSPGSRTITGRWQRW